MRQHIEHAFEVGLWLHAWVLYGVLDWEVSKRFFRKNSFLSEPRALLGQLGAVKQRQLLFRALCLVGPGPDDV